MNAGPNDLALLAALRLNLVSGIGPRLAQALLTELGSIDAVFAAGTDRLQQVPGIGKKLAGEIVDARYQTLAELEVGLCRDAGVNLLLRGSTDYPRMLGEICDPPGVLYSRGTFEARDEIAVAIVGARRCTLYGRQQAERLAGQLARAGVTIVSGLARGIDASAHLGAISAGGRTIAVMATGLAKIYPPEHAELANEVSGAGAVVSESHMGQAPIAGLFPQRNRIISGLSLDCPTVRMIAV